MVTYKVLIEPGDATHAFGVIVPDLPGCFSAGESLEDAIRRTADAITSWIEAARDLGQSIPPPSTSIEPRDGWLMAEVTVAD